MTTADLFALASAIGWASGLRLYAVVFVVGVAGAAGWLELPPGLALLQSTPVLIASGGMLLVEFFADKIPWLDSLWDTVHAFIRIPAGAMLAASVFGLDDTTFATIAALLGGSLSATALTTKMTARAAVNTSPEPFSNWGLSFLEDGLAVGMIWLALQHPLLFTLVLVMVLALSVGLLIVLFKFLRAVLRRIFRCLPALQSKHTNTNINTK